jgi:hypothetical protein
MDPLPPIVPHQSDPPPVSPLTRVDPTRREGRGGSGQGGGGRRQGRQGDQVGDLDLQASHRDLDDAVRLAIDGVAPDADGPGAAPAGDPGEEPRPHVDLTA